MKKIGTILLVISFSAITNQLFSQIKIGPTVGLNLSTMTMKYSGMSLDPKTKAGFHIGCISEINIAKNFYLQPGLIFTTKGSKYSVKDYGYSYDISISPSFIELPVNALYKIDVSSIKVFLLAGPSFAYGIGGKYKENDESDDIKFGSGDDKDMKPFDLGLNMGAGMEVKNFQLMLQYNLGLLNLAPVTDNDAEMKTRVFSISLAYLFSAK